MRPIRVAIGATTINFGLLTCAEKLQYERYPRREEMNAAIMSLLAKALRSRQSWSMTAFHPSRRFAP